MKKVAYLLLGSNMGDRLSFLEASIIRLRKVGIEVLSTSPIYRSKAWGLEDQPDFLNQVCKISTTLSPEILLQCILEIENQMGRKREVKWGPRVLDIDILFYEELVLQTEDLVIPHPGIADRRFTLMPLAAISPTLIHPVLQTSIEDLLKNCQDTGYVMMEETSASL